MIKVIESSAQRLRLQLGRLGISTGICTFDRESNVADIARFAFLGPYQHKRITLSDVRGIVVKRNGSRKTYHPMFELKFGKDVAMGGYTKEDAMEAAKTIGKFLAISR